jgi:hypothetical protein
MCCGQKRAALKSASSPTPTPSMMQGVGNLPPSSTVHQATTRRGSYYPSPPATQDAYNTRPMPGTVQQAPRRAGSSYSFVTLRYLENSPIVVRGLTTGKQYEFSSARPLQSVDARDAGPLLRTRFFRRDS